MSGVVQNFLRKKSRGHRNVLCARLYSIHPVTKVILGVDRKLCPSDQEEALGFMSKPIIVDGFSDKSYVVECQNQKAFSLTLACIAHDQNIKVSFIFLRSISNLRIVLKIQDITLRIEEIEGGFQYYDNSFADVTEDEVVKEKGFDCFVLKHVR